MDLGGTVLSAFVLSGAAPVIANGLANSTTVSAFGTLTASGGLRATPGSGQIANTIVRDGGQDIVTEGGLAHNTQLIGGMEIVSAGGSAYTTSVGASGSQTVSNGGSAFTTTIADGQQIVLAGGYASGAIVAGLAGGSQVISADGIADSTQDGGLVQIMTGGLERSLFVASNGTAALMGGTISAAVVAAGGSITGYGTTQGTIANAGTITASGGTLDLTNGAAGTVNQGQFIVDAGAILKVDGNVTARDVHVLAGGTAVVNGVVLNLDPVEVDAGGTLIGFGTISGIFTNSGSILASGGALTFADAFTGPGTLGVEDGGTLTFDGSFGGTGPVQVGGLVRLASITGGETFDFTGPGATLALGAETGSSTLAAFGQGDALDFLNQPGLAVSSSGNALTVTSSGADVAVFGLTAQPAGATYQVVADGMGGTSVQATSAACFCHGTRIDTPQGGIEVERLAIGALVRTQGGEAKPILWIGRRSYVGRFLAANPKVQPIRFRANSLRPGVPQRDLLVSPEHAMLLDGVFIPARVLVNGSSIATVRITDRVDYVHIELDGHDIVYAEGAETETFIDDDSRFMFHNASDYAALYPSGRERGDYRAPRLESGYQVEAVRQRLALMAEIAA